MKFRPGDIPAGDPDPGSEVQWVDNRVSNTMAWAAYRFVPAWCQSEDHWTARLAQYLFTDCPCCLLFRGITVGMAAGMTLTLMIVLAWLAMFWALR